MWLALEFMDGGAWHRLGGLCFEGGWVLRVQGLLGFKGFEGLSFGVEALDLF